MGAGVVILLVVIVVLAVLAFQVFQPADPLGSKVDSHDYQAVFLASNEVFFGKLETPAGPFVYLRHVYRLTAQSGSAGKPLQRKLVRLTADVHSPLDLMIINRAQILYVENLNPTGQAARFFNSGGP